MVRMGLAERLELVGRAAVLEAAAGVHVGQNDDLVGRQDLGGLGHEADAAKGDHLGVGRLRLARQIEAVADEVGQVLDFGRLVIMGEQDGVALRAQPVDLGSEVEAPEACIGCVHLTSSSLQPARLSIAASDPSRPIEKHRLFPSRWVHEPHRHAGVNPCRAKRHGEAPRHRAHRRVARQARRSPGTGLAHQLILGAPAIGLIERPFGIGERHNEAALRIFLNLVEIDLRAGNFKGRQSHAEGAGRRVPGEMLAPQPARSMP